MSVVTNVILSVNVLDEYLVPDVDNWIKLNHYYYNRPLDVGYYWAGNKAFEASVYVAVYNYFDTKSFIDYVFKSIEWEYPESVQLMLKTEEETRFSITSFVDNGGFVCHKCGMEIDKNITRQHCKCGRYYFIYWRNSDKYTVLRLETV